MITHGLRKGDEHPAYTPVEYGTLYIYLFLKPFGSPVPLIDRMSLVFTDVIFAYFFLLLSSLASFKHTWVTQTVLRLTPKHFVVFIVHPSETWVDSYSQSLRSLWRQLHVLGIQWHDRLRMTRTFISFIHSFIHLFAHKSIQNTQMQRQVKPSRTARLTMALTAALKTIKTV